MTKNDFLSVRLTGREKLWGFGYLAFQLLFLPQLFNMVILLLPISLDSTQVNMLYFSLNFLAVVLIFPRYLLSFFPISGKQLLRILAMGTAFFILYWVLSVAIGYLVGLLQPEFTNKNDQNIIGMAQGNYGLIFVATVILAPITEECFYRGVLFRGLYDHSPILAWVVSVAVFAAIHVIGYLSVLSPLSLVLSFVQYLPAGLCLAASYRLSGTIICPILIHAAINATGMLVLR